MIIPVINTVSENLIKTRLNQLCSRMVMYVPNKIREKIIDDICDLFDDEINISEIIKKGGR